jgi:hypothetical protein
MSQHGRAFCKSWPSLQYPIMQPRKISALRANTPNHDSCVEDSSVPIGRTARTEL